MNINQINPGDTFFTRDGEIAILQRIETGADKIRRVYGYPCTGPLANSTNGRGDLNYFALEVDFANC